MINKNNMINYSPISNPNLYPQNSNLQNLYNPTIMKNNSINLKGNLSLSSQSAKNTNPNVNINSADNLSLNSNLIQNIPFKMNNPNMKMLVNNIGERQSNNAPFRTNFPNNLSLNNFMVKNNINNFHYDVNNHNNKNYFYGGKKKEFNQEFNDNMKKSNSNNRINNNFNKIKNNNDGNINNIQNNRRIQLLKLNLKNGKKIINLEIYPDNYLETIKKLKLEIGLSDNYINLIFDRIKKAVIISKEIFKENLDYYYYKQITNLKNLNETKIKSYIGNKRNSKSLKGKCFFNRFKHNDIKLNICDIKNTAKLNNSF